MIMTLIHCIWASLFYFIYFLFFNVLKRFIIYLFICLLIYLRKSEQKEG